MPTVVAKTSNIGGLGGEYVVRDVPAIVWQIQRLLVSALLTGLVWACFHYWRECTDGNCPEWLTFAYFSDRFLSGASESAKQNFELIWTIGTIVEILRPKENFELIWAVCAAPFAVRCVLRVLRTRVLWNGCRFDFAEGTIQFPGGNISANSFWDEFRPTFLLQDLMRFTARMDEVRMLKEEDAGPLFGISFNGTFGAVAILFFDKSKRDEVFSFMRQKGQMGQPVSVT
jgi:hypothetical protein